MGKRYFRKLAGLLILVMLAESMATMEGRTWKKDALAEVTQEDAVSVTTSEEFMTALSQNKSYIIINGNITVGDKADSTGKMCPVEIPAGTTIQGTADASLDCRCPIQLAGDNVTIKDLEILFSSSDALGSVPHREIFLGGYSLTLDNVKTYLAGSGGSLGGFGGTEEELLPSVYAGGFEGSTIGDYAQLTVKNANSKTMFKEIYMSHETGADEKVPYTGVAKLYLSPGVVIREGVFTEQNSNVEILISGSGNLSDLNVYGNANTTLQIQQSTLYRAMLNKVENLILEDAAYLELQQGSLENVTLEGKACLNLNTIVNCIINGNFTGGTNQLESQIDTRGFLVLNKEGAVQIKGMVDNTTIFCIENQNFPGEYTEEKQYICASTRKEGAEGFVLPDSKSNSYRLQYQEGVWTVSKTDEEEALVVGSIDITFAPTQVDISKIKGKALFPAEQAPYCSVYWKDTKGNTVSFSDVVDYGLYFDDTIIGVKSAYWNGEEGGDALDWGNQIQFVTLDSTPNQYYFYVDENAQAKTGDYTFLFLSAYQELGKNTTVADIKALKDKVKAEMPVYFYDSTNGTSPKPTETLSPTITVKPEITNAPIITEVPCITASPGTGNQPVETEIPSQTMNPGTGNQPTETEVPSQTMNPGAGNSPIETKVPSQTINPGAGNQPMETKVPSQTMNPGAGSQPIETEIPIKTMLPGTSNQPKETEKPSKTMLPGISIQPIETEKPSKTIAPEITNPPKETEKPSETIVPGTSIQPTETEIPSKTMNPENGNQPITTAVPSVEGSPNITPTLMPEHSHLWDLGEITKTPTVVEKGEKTYTCTICGQQKIETLPTSKIPNKGTVLTDKKTKAKYKVTKSGSEDATVTYIKPTKANAQTVVIPNQVTVDGVQYKVTSIASKAFINCEKLKYVTIGKNIKKIGAKALYGCKSLKKLTIKTTDLKKQNIGKNAFGKMNTKAIVQVPAKQLKKYQNILKEKGLSSKVKVRK